jgi:hypothetical protein
MILEGVSTCMVRTIITIHSVRDRPMGGNETRAYNVGLSQG